MTNFEIIKSLYKRPFYYDPDSQSIFDANGAMALDIRGWGRIQYMENAEIKQEEVEEVRRMEL